ncbi:amidophosphoribosyltransferase [Nonomuraea sp. KM90]|uniref:amidophosphoribosyltransferase n=1 Tax=Nonomuraea sp. KM90 TaxID=3457428 RepID=UPI003FCED0D7
MLWGDAGEECGVVGIWTHGEPVAEWLRDGLFALQHRGQESAGLALSCGADIAHHTGMGLVSEVLTHEALQGMKGHLGIGHVRYSTSGDSSPENAQPVIGQTGSGEPFALAHNGNLTRLPSPARTSDTHLLAAQVAAEPGTLADALADVLPRTNGAFSLVGISADVLYAARDPHGFRPLSIGRLPGNGWAVASETAALDSIGAVFHHEVEPGEIAEMGAHGLRVRSFASGVKALCVFEHVYFSRADSVIDGRSVYEVRNAMGRALARQAPARADLVIPVPDTARVAALGYAEESGIPYAEGFVRNAYATRTFIQPSRQGRQLGVRRKLSPIVSAVRGRRLVVVDDSIVRATSMKQVVSLLKEAGAAEVHVRVASPPVRWPCFFGVDIRTTGELVAGRYGVAQIQRILGADSLGYLSIGGLVESTRQGGDLCTACFTGAYPDAVALSAAPGPASRGREPV